MSLSQSVKINGLDTQAYYLRDEFECLPTLMYPDVDSLVPQNRSPSIKL
ncbi:MAG: hypothetical protein AAF699_07355 [Pseudomonadota bacterium]